LALGLEAVPNDVTAPPPTDAEVVLRELLREAGIPFRVDQVIWYCSQTPLTPDFIISDHLVIEVEGAVHDERWIQTHDRIRERALTDLGYEVRFLTNDQVFRGDERLLDEVIWWHRTAKSSGLVPRIRPIDPPKLRPANLNRIDLDRCIEQVGQQLEDQIRQETLEKGLRGIDPVLLDFPGLIEVVSLGLLGCFLTGGGAGTVVDFTLGQRAFEAGLSLLNSRFGENAARGLKNQLVVTTPNFFKNLIFLGGPLINQGIVSISSLEDFRKNIEGFNRAFSELGIVAGEKEAIAECHEQLKQKPGLASRPDLAWLAG